jgi:hypothetical protein
MPFEDGLQIGATSPLGLARPVIADDIGDKDRGVPVLHPPASSGSGKARESQAQ